MAYSRVLERVANVSASALLLTLGLVALQSLLWDTVQLSQAFLLVL